MKRLAAVLLIGVFVTLILQPVSLTVNSLSNNQPTRADGFPIPPIPPQPGMLMADNWPIPPIPPQPGMLMADNWPIPPIPPTRLVNGAVWVA